LPLSDAAIQRQIPAIRNTFALRNTNPLLLENFFSAVQSPGSGTRKLHPGWINIDDSQADAPLPDRCRDAFTTLCQGGYLGIAVKINARSRLRRLFALLGIRSRMASAERALAGCGATIMGRFGVSPDIHSPTVVYHLATPAAEYA